MAMKVRWIVVFKIETNPPEVIQFDSYDDAYKVYESAAGSWTGVYLCRIVHGPKDECDVESREEPCTREYHDGQQGVV